MSNLTPEAEKAVGKVIEGCWFVFALAVLAFWVGVFAWAYQSVKG